MSAGRHMRRAPCGARRRYRSLTAVCLLICATCCVAAMRKGPYLYYPGTPTSMTVLWQLDTTSGCTLEWGTNLSYAGGSVGTTEYGEHQHRFTITNLTAQTKYYYRVTANATQHPGTFRTGPPLTATDTSFFLYGDSRSNPSQFDQSNGRLLDEVAGEPGLQTLVLSSGDLVLSDSETYWQDHYFNRAQSDTLELQANMPVNACIGNHEGAGAGFVKYLPYPFVAGRYWSFDYGPAHIVVVDQYTSYAPGSAQYNWIAADLAGTDKVWKFLLLHQPGWGAMTGRNDGNVQSRLQPLCVSNEVAAVLAGHNHHYSRCSVDGIEHVTSGGAGAGLYNVDLAMPYVVTAARAYHYCLVRIAGELCTITAKALDGTVLDTFTLTNALPVAGTVAFDQTASSDTEAAGLAQLSVSVAPEPSGSGTVGYTITGGTASNGHDYALADGVLTLGPGLTNRQIAVTILQDVLDEPAETLLVTLTNGAGLTLGTPATHTYTILDDDEVTVSFAEPGRTVTEAAGIVNVPVALSGPSLQMISVQFLRTGGTAQGGSDYLRPPGTLLFVSGETGKTFATTVLQDLVDEDAETVVFSLSNAVNATLGPVPAYTLTITDDDTTAVQFAGPTSSVSEHAGTAGLDVVLTLSSAKPVTVGYTPSGGTASNGVDFVLAPGTLTFAPGSTTEAVPVPILRDRIVDDGETFMLTLHDPVNALLGARTLHTCTIQDVPVRTAFDFDADGKADPAVFHPDSGTWYLQRSTEGFIARQFGWSAALLVPCDYDNDGRTDLAVCDGPSAVWYVQGSADGFSTRQFGWSETRPVPADFDADGRADLAVYYGADGTWYRLRTADGFEATQFGWSRPVPVPADYDGDGRADLALYDPPSGNWHVLGSSEGYSVRQFGWGEPIPVPADYDGDGRADPALYHPPTGTWYVLGSADGFHSQQFGWSEPQPVPADYDGDGRADLALYHQPTGTWHIMGSLDGYRQFQFGWWAAVPLAGRGPAGGQ